MAGIKDISDLIKDTPRDIDPGFSIDIFEGMSEEEKERFKKQMEFMLRGFAIDPYKGKSEEEIKKIKERNRIQRIIRERQREEMGLPEGIQLLNQGGMMDIDRMTAPLGYADGGFENRMSMLRESMMDTENQRMREPDITSVAMTIAQQEGDTSEENINLIIRQLQALMPSLTKTMEKELTPMSTQGLKYLFDKMNVATGRKSDPRLNRSVGFGRVE